MPFLYHASPVKNDESIRDHGLKPNPGSVLAAIIATAITRGLVDLMAENHDRG